MTRNTICGMPDYLLTFELSKDGDELFIHADDEGLLYLASELTILARDAKNGQKDHRHLISDAWAGSELSAVPQDPECQFLNKVTIHAWPTSGGVRDVNLKN